MEDGSIKGFIKMPQIFPNATAENRVICVTGIGANKEFSALMVDIVPDLEVVSKNQCFPLKLYEETVMVEDSDDMFRGQVQDGISNAALTHFQKVYPDEEISQRRSVLLSVWGFALRGLPDPIP